MLLFTTLLPLIVTHYYNSVMVVFNLMCAMLIYVSTCIGYMGCPNTQSNIILEENDSVFEMSI